jgi:putative addiction module component (TIGR02574 family)
MNARITQELQHLSAAEKHALGEALIGSADSEASAPLITDAQRKELRARLAQHRANPSEPGLTFSQIKAQLLGKAA